MNGQRCAHILDEVDAPLDVLDYYAAFAGEGYSFLLDSGADPRGVGRYSFAGRRPFLVFRSKRGAIEVVRDGHSARFRGDPFEALRATMSDYRIDPGVYADSEIPFLGGAVGYFGYELCQHIERLPSRGTDDLALPDCCFLFVDCVLIRDHRDGRTWVSALGFAADEDVARRRARYAVARMRADMERAEAVGAKASDPASRGAGAELEIRSMLGRAAYMEVVRRAKEHIVAGDAYEICTTHRLECDFRADPFQLYRDLRRINPAPFASYLNLPDVKVVSASPERHLRLGRDGRAESRPIKGTRPRGDTPARDRELRQELLTSEKDRAENLMIVDLVRNDLGRVCRVGTVGVPELMEVEAHPTVFQMVSTVVGELEADKDVFDLVRAAFPGGSMTGAPKIEAMSIIDSLEPVQRGIYSGSIGYLDFAGNADLSIVIRTILVKNRVAYLQVGGAIVADSDPEAEYRETLDKARALVQALRITARSRGELRAVAPERARSVAG
jgi:para-aminobenzoate synthetase component 1